MANVQKKLAKWGKRNAVSKRFRASSDKATIANWTLELDKPLQVFKVCYIAWVEYVANLLRSEGVRDQRKSN